jgi:hypothetical protein
LERWTDDHLGTTYRGRFLIVNRTGDRGAMNYAKPELRALGTLSGLTMGQNGSCPDGGGLNNTQLGGMSDCGVSGGMMG